MPCFSYFVHAVRLNFRVNSSHQTLIQLLSIVSITIFIIYSVLESSCKLYWLLSESNNFFCCRTFYWNGRKSALNQVWTGFVKAFLFVWHPHAHPSTKTFDKISKLNSLHGMCRIFSVATDRHIVQSLADRVFVRLHSLATPVGIRA